jgi:outer membrane protein TolC
MQKMAEALKLKGLQQDIMLNVALRYLAIFNRRANLQVAQDFHNTIAKVYEDATSRFAVGLIKKSDLLKFKVDLDNAVIALKKAQAEEKKSIRLLQREIDADPRAEQLSFEEFATLPAPLDQARYQAEMLEHRSEIKALEELIQAAEARVNVAYAKFYPRVDLSSGYKTTDDSLVSNSNGVNEEEYRTTLMLSMNLFDGFDKYAKVNIAKLEAQGIRYDLAELKNDLNSQLDNLFLDYAVNVDNVVVAESSIVQAEENLRVNRLSYQEGVTTESDLLDAITNLSRARSNYVAAKSEVFDNYFRITRAVEKF